MKTVLVTGGAGFIGSNFVRFLLKAEPLISIVNLDALTYAGTLKNLEGLDENERHLFVHGNICDQMLVEELLRKHNIRMIVHFAAESHVDRSIANPKSFMETNAIGTLSLLEAARTVWLEENITEDLQARFHHVSTDEVYGTLGPDDLAFTETTPYSPNSPYSASKAASDHLVRAYGHTYGLPISITNCSNNYGPYQFPEKLIPLILSNALSGIPIPVYGDGQQIRDWLYVDDHCEAIWSVASHGATGETYNIGGDNQVANLTLIHKICAILDDKLPESPHKPHSQLIEFVADRPGHDWRYAMNNAKIAQELGWHPRESLDSGLRKTVEWYLGNLTWFDAIKQQMDYQQWVTKNYQERV